MKKITDFTGTSEVPGIKKLFRVMKLTGFFLMISVMTVWAGKTYSQTKTLNLNMERSTVKEVLSEIERQSEFYFMYSGKYVDVDREVSVHVESQKIETVLNILFSGTDVGYSIKDRFIVLTTPEIIKNGTLTVVQQKTVSGKVTDGSGNSLPGVTVVVKGTTIGTVTNKDGNYMIGNIPEGATLVFSFVGMKTQEVEVAEKTTIPIIMQEESVGIDEVVAIGYGVQRKSDITGSVTSLSKERLNIPSNLNIAQAIQGAVPGVMIKTSSAGAVPNEVIMIRGRNSIKADNSPLIIVDGIPYGGHLVDLNPQDIESVEILKDASAAAIYGSRGSNGVILVTSKSGLDGKSKITYNGSFSLQSFVKLPDLQDGEEFYKRKNERDPGVMTPSEIEVYNAGEWVDWVDLTTRNGYSNQHNISVSGGWENTKYYISGGVTDIQGLGLNDDYLRITSRVNIDTKITDWLTIGTRTNFSYDDMGGISCFDPEVFHANPLTRPYDEDGNISIYPWAEEIIGNSLQSLLADNLDQAYQLITTNYALITVPFIKGLQYRLNTSVMAGFNDKATYYGRDTQIGLGKQGYAETERSRYNNNVIENIVSYNRELGKHNVFFTGLYSYESIKNSANLLTGSGFPHDFLTWYSMAQANQVVPAFQYSATTLISQMLRFNYSYDSRYLLTLTGRRDGYSGFGAKNKWGLFPSLALGWNIMNEDFFTLDNIFNQLKIRCSYGLNGNQAVTPYETISRLSEKNYVAGASTIAGYNQSKLGMDNLGWESTKAINFGIDFGILENRIIGDINLYKSNTSDLLLDRTISAVHGITQITQNIGKTENKGFEASFTSRNFTDQNFKWVTSGSISFNKNKIISLYGELDEEGNEIDDMANLWFIGQPINIVYTHVWDGTWQLDEADEAAKWGSKPGYVKLKDLDSDGHITTKDMKIIGQTDPKFLWGMNNSWTYKNFTLAVFIHGVHGVTKRNSLMDDDMYGGYRRNTIRKNYWSPDNPTNDWYANDWLAGIMDGVTYTAPPENASFIRIKDISLTYDIPKRILDRIKMDNFQIYVTGRNLYTFTKWNGLDPELDEQRAIPLQKEYVFGINVTL